MLLHGYTGAINVVGGNVVNLLIEYFFRVIIDKNIADVVVIKRLKNHPKPAVKHIFF
jgi:hypothetical protein